MQTQSFTAALAAAFGELGRAIIGFVPNVVVAIAIFLVGWLIGAFIARAVAHLIRGLKVDNALRGAGVEELLRRAGYNLDSGKFVGMLTKWFVVIVFLIAAFDLVGLSQINILLQQVVVLFLPQVVIAVVVLLLAALIAEAVQQVVVGAAKAAELAHAHLFGAVARWAIWIFAIITALYQLGIAQPLIQSLLQGVVIALALAVGLSFGLGGQAAASEYIKKIQKEISKGK